MCLYVPTSQSTSLVLCFCCSAALLLHCFLHPTPPTQAELPLEWDLRPRGFTHVLSVVETSEGRYRWGVVPVAWHYTQAANLPYAFPGAVASVRGWLLRGGVAPWGQCACVLRWGWLEVEASPNRLLGD